MPLWYLKLMSKFSNKRSLVHARHTARLANEVAKNLVDSKAEALLQGKGSKDILSLLGMFSVSPRFDSQFDLRSSPSQSERVRKC